MIKLSIVATLYRSEEFLKEFCSRCLTAGATVSDSLELILVDDGSPDNSLELALQLRKDDSRIKVIELSRNFGHHFAILAGLEAAQGEFIFLLDSDLEEDPENIAQFWQKLQEEDLDAVFGVQEDFRRGGLSEKLFGSLFYTGFNAMSAIKIPRNLCTIRLMTRQYVQALLDMGDANVFLGGQFAWLGFKQRPFPLKKSQRRATSSYSLFRKLKLCFDAVSSFSSYPIQLAFYLGTALFLASSLWGAYLFFRKLLLPDAVMSGWSSIMVSIWFLGGLIILILGLIGMYVAKIFTEVKGRQRFIIRRFHGSED